MKKKIITKKYSRWKIIDFIFLFVILYVILNTLTSGNIEWLYVYTHTDSSIIWILWTFILLIVLLVKSIPYIAIYIGFRYAIKRYNRERITFDVEYDLEYYREKFNGISPATMSLLMDLELEIDKDLGAMKLYYELNNIYIYEKDGRVYLNNPKGVKLNKSDEILLNYFFYNKNDYYILNEWRQNVISESINNNLIRRKNDKEKRKQGCGKFLFVNLITLFFIIYVVFNFENYSNFFAALDTMPVDNLGLMEFFSNNPGFIPTLVILFTFSIAIFVYAWSFISGIIHFVVSSVISAKDKFKRTREGNILTEKLYGMKNFIRDFSNLDEATKKHLVLWEEFLIYAVILEENDNVLSEISNIYHTDLFKYKNYKY